MHTPQTRIDIVAPSYGHPKYTKCIEMHRNNKCLTSSSARSYPFSQSLSHMVDLVCNHGKISHHLTLAVHSVAEAYHTIRPHPTQCCMCFKEYSFYWWQWQWTRASVHTRAIVESLTMKNPVAVPAVVGTTDKTCSVLLYLQLVRVAYPKSSVQLK